MVSTPASVQATKRSRMRGFSVSRRGVPMAPDQVQRVARRCDPRRAEQAEHLAEPGHGRNCQGRSQVGVVLDALVYHAGALRVEGQQHAHAPVARLGSRCREPGGGVASRRHRRGG